MVKAQRSPRVRVVVPAVCDSRDQHTRSAGPAARAWPWATTVGRWAGARERPQSQPQARWVRLPRRFVLSHCIKSSRNVWGIVRWIRSALGGEVSIADLDARRGAGTAAYSLLDEANAAAGDDRSTRLFRLCAWNAFALQTIADTLIAADAAGDPATAGYVPRSTQSYAAACLNAVPEWIRQARVVISDPAARIASDLPARLPRWQHDEPTKHIELRGLRAAFEALQPRVESDLEAFCAGASPDRAREVARLRRVCAEMASNADYANALDLRSAGPVDRGEVRWRLLDALEHAFELGQLLALPIGRASCRERV